MPESKDVNEEPKVEPVTPEERIDKLEKVLDTISQNQNAIINTLQKQPAPASNPSQPESEKGGILKDVVLPLITKEIAGGGEEGLNAFFAQVGKQDFALFRKALMRRYIRMMDKPTK